VGVRRLSRCVSCRGTFSSSDRLHSIDGHIKTIPEGAETKTKKAGWFHRASTPGGDKLFHITGHYDRVLYIAPVAEAGAAAAPPTVLADLTTAPVAPKYVLPISLQVRGSGVRLGGPTLSAGWGLRVARQPASAALCLRTCRVVPLQGPWESRRLWQFATSELQTRPKVAWDVVDREKAQLEEEQRLLPCHLHKEGKAGHAAWATKRFHLRTVPDLVAGKDAELYIFDDLRTEPFKAGDLEQNMLHLSRALPDVRGGLRGAGESAARLASMRPVSIYIVYLPCGVARLHLSRHLQAPSRQT